MLNKVFQKTQNGISSSSQLFPINWVHKNTYEEFFCKIQLLQLWTPIRSLSTYAIRNEWSPFVIIRHNYYSKIGFKWTSLLEMRKTEKSYYGCPTLERNYNPRNRSLLPIRKNMSFIFCGINKISQREDNRPWTSEMI